jgi:transketolase
MRDAFSKSLITLAQADPNLILFTGDHGYALFDEFRKLCPNQYINVGIAEQNMVGMAAGLARLGYRPFVYGLASFVPIRVLEQIKLDIAHDDLPVVLVGDGAGFVYSHLGTSHQSTEDIACMRSIPKVDILSPADRFEMTACMDFAYSVKKTIYLRIGKSDLGDVHTMALGKLESGRLLKIRQGRSGLPGLIATGSMVRMAVDIAKEHDLTVWSAPVIKPIMADDVCVAIRESKGLLILEEHSIFGGLGSAIAEISSELMPTNILRIGVQDRFSEHCGTYSYLRKEHGLDIDSIREKVLIFIQKKDFNSLSAKSK